MALKIPVGSEDHVQGDADAPVTLVEYGDYQCPYCAQADQIVKQLQQAFGDRLRFVFRNMPLTQIHPLAELAAEAAESAALQGRFWDMHDLLYDNQRQLGAEMIEAAAQRLKLDLDAFNAAINQRQTLPRIKADVQGALDSGVKGTPSFFVNGAMADDWSFDGLSRAIAAALPGG